MKVISFKVNDNIYFALRKKNVSFRYLFEPRAVELAQNSTNKAKYTYGIRKNNDDLYNNLCLIQKTINKIMKSYDFGKNIS